MRHSRAVYSTKMRSMRTGSSSTMRLITPGGVPPKAAAKDFAKEELEEAALWVGGLDRIHKTRGILACHDLSATPFAPTGRRSTEETLFGWIISDFGLNDAIEAGLVKTPRVVIRDDGKLTSAYKSRLYHIYADTEVKDDINRRAEEHEPLPDLVQQGYYPLGKDWLEAAQKWKNAGAATPPVLITVANRTETAARIKYTFDHGRIRIEELCAPERTLHIDCRAAAKSRTFVLKPRTKFVLKFVRDLNAKVAPIRNS
jgi:type III restriction enzyme